MTIFAIRPAGNPIHFLKIIRSTLNPWHADRDIRGLALESGTAALTVSVQAAVLARPDVDEPFVIVPAYCCPDVVTAVLSAGASVRVTDVAPGSLWPSDDQLLASLDRKTVAVVDVFAFGARPNRSPATLQNLVDAGISLIADRAQCRPSLTVPAGYQMSIYSFGRGKPTTLGYGGLLCLTESSSATAFAAYRRSAPPRGNFSSLARVLVRYLAIRVASAPIIFARLRAIRWLGIGRTRTKSISQPRRAPPWAERLMLAEATSPKAGACLAQTAYFNANWSRSRLTTALPESSIDDELWRYPIIAESVRERDELLNKLTDLGHGVSEAYGASITHFFPELRDTNSSPSDTEPNADNIAGRLLTLPTHFGVSRERADAIVSVATGRLGAQ